ncbi:MAG: GGDEF domain-containing protein [Elusimicrobia bacterium]|nr:GGDEF domain-containing protein [Elusimicrobiota bacterium]
MGAEDLWSARVGDKWRILYTVNRQNKILRIYSVSDHAAYDQRIDDLREQMVAKNSKQQLFRRVRKVTFGVAFALLGLAASAGADSSIGSVNLGLVSAVVIALTLLTAYGAVELIRYLNGKKPFLARVRGIASQDDHGVTSRLTRPILPVTKQEFARENRRLRDRVNQLDRENKQLADVSGALLEKGIELTEENRRLEELATMDQLTGLPNRRAWKMEMTKALHHLDRNGEPFSVIHFDIDNFKKINDQHGHQTGDEALKIFARTIREVIRQDDFAGRLGGEEFAVILHNTDRAGTAAAAQKILTAIRALNLNLPDGERLPIRASMGIAAAPDDISDWEKIKQEAKENKRGMEDAAEELYIKADEALYFVKENGKDNFAFYPNTLGKNPADFKPVNEGTTGNPEGEDPRWAIADETFRAAGSLIDEAPEPSDRNDGKKEGENRQIASAALRLTAQIAKPDGPQVLDSIDNYLNAGEALVKLNTIEKILGLEVPAEKEVFEFLIQTIQSKNPEVAQKAFELLNQFPIGVIATVVLDPILNSKDQNLSPLLDGRILPILYLRGTTKNKAIGQYAHILLNLIATTNPASKKQNITIRMLEIYLQTYTRFIRRAAPSLTQANDPLSVTLWILGLSLIDPAAAAILETAVLVILAGWGLYSIRHRLAGLWRGQAKNKNGTRYQTAKNTQMVPGTIFIRGC